MSHVQPKDIITVQYIGTEPTRFTPFIGGQKQDIQPNEKIDMDARQAAVVLIDHLRWKQIGAKRDAFSEKQDKEDKEEKDEKPKAKKSK
jgi:hypothetical protein